MSILGANIYILGGDMSILRANMYHQGTNMQPLGTRVYLLKKVQPQWQLLYFFFLRVWVGLGLG